MMRTTYVAMLICVLPFTVAEAQDRVFAVQPGFGLGFSAGLVGSNDEALQNSMGYEGYFRYGWSFGLFLNGGVQTSTNGFEDASQKYRTTSFFLEPRYVALFLSK